MGKTHRKEPSSGCYMRRLRHMPMRRGEEKAEHELEGLPARHWNRIVSSSTRIANPWDDKVVSEFRGQEWHRKNMDVLT